MNWLQFTAALVKAFVWPLAFFGVFFLYRVELKKLIKTLTHVKYKDFVLGFENIENQAQVIEKETSVEIHPKQQDRNPMLLSLEDQIKETFNISPPGAILLAWSSVEMVLQTAVKRLLDLPPRPARNRTANNIKTLNDAGYLPKTHYNLLLDMKSLRNKIAHETGAYFASHNQVSGYTQAASAMVKFLNWLEPKK